MKFKVGDRVRMTEEGEKLWQYSGGGEGVITSASGLEFCKVDWDNGNSDRYRVKYLGLVSVSNAHDWHYNEARSVIWNRQYAWKVIRFCPDCGEVEDMELQDIKQESICHEKK